jgi:putative ABC transport system substrate-binding protein
MRRREFMWLLGGLASALPLTTPARSADQPRLVGVLMASRPNDAVSEGRLAAFRDGLAKLGWMDGRNVRFELRYAGGDRERARAGAAELVKLGPDVIFSYGTVSIAALKAATQSIPVVFAIVNDPVAQGFVPNFDHPGGNITGFSFIDYSMIGKALGLLKQIAPAVTRVGFLFDPDDYPYYEVYLRSFQEQRQALALDVTPMRVHSDAEIGAAIAPFAATPNGAIIAPPSAFNTVHRHQIVEATLQHTLPAIVHLREAVAEGGLMCYAPDETDIFLRAVPYVDRILKGAKPGDLPVQAPTKFDFVINLKTAKVLGLNVPANLLAIADEVIE